LSYTSRVTTVAKIVRRVALRPP